MHMQFYSITRNCTIADTMNAMKSFAASNNLLTIRFLLKILLKFTPIYLLSSTMYICTFGAWKRADVKNWEGVPGASVHLYYCSTISCSRGGHVPRASTTYCIQSLNYKHHEVHKCHRGLRCIWSRNLVSRCSGRQHRKELYSRHSAQGGNCSISSFSLNEIRYT